MTTQPATALRIAVVLKTNEGGLWILPHLHEMSRRGHHPVVVIPSGDGRLRRELDEAAFTVVESQFNFRLRPTPSTLLGLRRLRKQLRSLKPDVLHYHLYASALATRLATVRMGVPRVHMVAGPLYLESALIRFFERILMRLDTVIVAGSEYTARVYRGLSRKGPSVQTVAYAMQAGQFRPAIPSDRAAARATLGLDEDTTLFVMVAYVYAAKRMTHKGRGIKGHDILLEAWQAVSASRPSAHLLLVGSGFDAAGETLRQELIERFNIQDDPTVTWLSTLSDVRPYYAAADVSVSPSLSENHGAARQASASGVASLVSDAGGLPETVDPDSGWIVPAGDVEALAQKMSEVASLGPQHLRAWGLRAAAREARNFDPETLAKALVDLLEETAQPNGQLRRP
ncbi:glycosyltransferase involved in cell wall biosynthesis [Aeromicrobium panaciterrae]|uniref:Glycosyltransferase involved in cell wall biosynthesis n=1 Tax=Aeromicrobium panaciterrae TaxID=363861 RepID=A0ABU1UL70_9ACTN|nr:glycosyltransferase [Aeromicrobium panaciterrae]MDR7085929.1 glycosyltransferase involved in cell wall biosynthesis [Aeromicrobium panaciterrae]